ncbi:ABC transporter ATP-binding protein [Lacticaseibacillus yichunensis]|uniref:ABC transporter ATP-binding protein n=1 Tax=Lacticaseibacillus yichunensis TaxID=2486015 RepID=A0ABW4CLY2_9LACO|nr:ABC transporter ATP-binding protein [Lacticaseibacillus yichunensis]
MRIVTVDHLTKIYGHRFNRVGALNDLSFHIDAGEFVGIMGPSGAGKSTLLNIIASIDTPTTGSVWVGGVDLTQLNDAALAKYRREQVGFIFQELNLLSDLTVATNITLPLTFVPPVPSDIDARLAHVADLLDLTGLLARYPTELSLGQRQRVAAARALITQPALILADEPTGSLDSMAATELLSYLTKLNLEEDRTIMMVTHDAFTASFCNRIIFIRDGAYFAEVTRSGSRQAFFDQIIDMEATINGGGKRRETPRVD